MELKKEKHMGNEVATKAAPDLAAIMAVLTEGNLQKLTLEQRAEYLRQLCESAGLNPLTQPIQFMTFQGRVVPYATKGAAEQLRLNHKLSIKIVDRRKDGDLYIVTAQATTPEGRTDEATGALDLAGLSGERLANAIMKTETKAKRRVTLSITGMNLLDEDEAASIVRQEQTGAAQIATIVRDAQEAERAPAPIWRYDVRKLDAEKRKASEIHLASIGAVYDTERECWLSSQRVKKLDNYQITEGAGEEVAHV